VGLGLYFLTLQYIEYCERIYTIADRVYGATFFMATGFHGLHVIVGTSLLLLTLIFITAIQETHTHHILFEVSAWYWHFVDVVWLFLYLNVYCWATL